MEFEGQVENAHFHLTNKKEYNYKYLHIPMNKLSLKKNQQINYADIPILLNSQPTSRGILNCPYM